MNNSTDDLLHLHRIIGPQKSMIEAYNAGYDNGLNGSNTSNCSFRYFSRPEMTKEWERGSDDGKKARTP